MRMPGRATQSGYSVWQWLIILVVVGLFLKTAAAIGPVYISNFQVRESIKAMQNEPELASKAINEIRLVVERRFDVNRIEVIQAVCRDKNRPCIKIEKSKTALVIDANYEARVHLLGNVDAVVMFKDNLVELPIPGGS
jgi:hypothetical protein